MQLVKLDKVTLDLEFDSATHTYLYNGRELKSVTTLLSEIGVSPDYSSVDNDLLEKAREKGVKVHSIIEEWVKLGLHENSYEITVFKEWLEQNQYQVIGSEYIVHNDYVAGTIDLVLLDTKTQELIVADIKTTSVIHTESVSWQNSIYAYLWNLTHKNDPICKSLVIHYGSEFVVKELEFKKNEYINDLMESVAKGVEYKLPTIVINDLELEAYKMAVQKLETYKSEIAAFENFVKEFYEKLTIAMEEAGVKSYEDDYVKFTYVAPTTRTTIDSARLKKELPDVAKQYSKETITKASVRTTFKVKKDEESTEDSD